MLHLRIEVPAHDGTALRGLRYAPSTEPAPTILSVTPYGADHWHEDAVYFASRGFNFVSMDCRGRGDSDGEFVPFVNDAADGNALVNRLAEHPWSNGDIVTYGGSYCGFAQWATAGTRPKPLRAIAPVASVHPGRDFPNANNIPAAYTVRWLTYVNGRRRNEGPFKDESLWRKAPRELIAANRPFRDLDLVTTGQRLPIFQEWLNHPEFDGYWRSMVPTAEQLAALDIPILTITGQYDDDQFGALTYYAAAPPHDLLIGPWDHAGTRTSNVEFGGLTFDDAAKIDLRALHVDWYTWALGKGDRPDFLAAPVTYFHIGENRWRSAQSLPTPEAALTLHLPTFPLDIDPAQAPARPELSPDRPTPRIDRHHRSPQPAPDPQQRPPRFRHPRDDLPPPRRFRDQARPARAPRPVDELPSQAVAGTVRIHQDPGRASYLRLPLAQ